MFDSFEYSSHKVDNISKNDQHSLNEHDFEDDDNDADADGIDYNSSLNKRVQKTYDTIFSKPFEILNPISTTNSSIINNNEKTLAGKLLKLYLEENKKNFNKQSNSPFVSY
jgi:hypothetical protein